MSLIRVTDPFLGHWWNIVDRPPRLFDQHFGSGLLSDDLLGPSSLVRALDPYRPLRLHSREKSGASEVRYDKDKFQVMLDVQQFKPEELDVTTVDNYIVITGKHEERQDEHGFISRSFTRRYMLPKDVKAEGVTCNLSSDGVLQVSAPRNEPNPPANQRAISINQTGQPAVTNTSVAGCQGQGGSGGDAEIKE